MATLLNPLMNFRNNQLTSSVMNGNSAPQKIPGGADSIRKNLGPDGIWDRNTGKRGPAGPLEQDYSKRQSLEKHLLTNQTQFVQYINMTQIVVPQRLPNSEDDAVSWLDLPKSVHAGDIVWALRCPPAMVNAQFASRLTRKTQFNYTTCINLATVNYVLFRLQSFFHLYEGVCCDPDNIIAFASAVTGRQQEKLYRDKLRGAASDIRAKGKQRFELWKKWLDHITESDDLRLEHILAWGMESSSGATQNKTPCFLEKWFTEVLMDMGVLEKIRTIKDADAKTEIGKALGNIFVARVQTVLWDFVHSNCRPLGIFIGSDDAGGAHQESMNPSTNWPNDFAGTIQCTGKSRRTSNIWNREEGFSSGHSLGFKMQTLSVSGNGVEFKLSSNPNTATTVKTCDTNALFPYVRQYSVLTPAVDVRENSFRSVSAAEKFMQPETFMRFACANQMSKQMNLSNNAKLLALDALAMGGCQPIEVIMRRTFYDYRDLNEYWKKVSLSSVFTKLNKPLAPVPSMLVPSYSMAEDPTGTTEDPSGEDLTEAATVSFENIKKPAKKRPDKKETI